MRNNLRVILIQILNLQLNLQLNLKLNLKLDRREFGIRRTKDHIRI